MILSETILYLFLNVFRVYIFYRFFGLFYEKSRQRKWVPFGYLLYYLINSACYLIIDYDKLNLILTLVSFLLIVLLGYKGGIRRKLLSFFASLGMGLLAENFAWGIFSKGRDDFMWEFGFFFSVFILWLMEILLEKTVKLRRRGETSLYKDFLVVLIIMGNMFISVVLIDDYYRNRIVLNISLCILLLVTLVVFYLYEKILKDSEKEKNEEMYELQLAMYQKQLEIMQGANDTYRIMRHDLKHHMALLLDYIGQNENERAMQYLGKMGSYIDSDNRYVRTGNKGIDSIFNYIIEEVEKRGGTIEIDIRIAEGLAVNDFDMNVILSNLLFNACEAISKSEKKEIRVVMEYDRGTLQIGVCNTYNGILSQKNGQLLSLKRGEKTHGTGLMSVRRTVEKYNGYMEVEHTEEEFKVNILLYI